MSLRLSQIARRLRFSTSGSSRIFRIVGLRPKRLDVVFDALQIFVTVFFLALPIVAVTVYFGFLASNQYQSETRFTVRPAAPALGKNHLAKTPATPTAKIVQDTQIVVNYIETQDIITTLQEKTGFLDLYRSRDIDILSRLSKTATSEDIFDYWEDRVDVSVSKSSGIITVTLRAFSPQAAQRILQETVRESERIVNEINDRIWGDVIKTARSNMEDAARQLKEAQEKLQITRNKRGVLSVEGSSNVLSTLLTKLQTERLLLEKRFDTQKKTVSPNAPQMKILRRQIEVLDSQITDLTNQVAGDWGSGSTLADASADLAVVELEASLAEKRFGVSVATLEQITFVSAQQMLYLDMVQAPNLPEEARYPKRWLWIGGTVFVCVVVWGLCMGLLTFARNQFKT